MNKKGLLYLLPAGAYLLVTVSTVAECVHARVHVKRVLSEDRFQTDTIIRIPQCQGKITH